MTWDPYTLDKKIADDIAEAKEAGDLSTCYALCYLQNALEGFNEALAGFDVHTYIRKLIAARERDIKLFKRYLPSDF